MFRSSRSQILFEIGALKYFALITGKNLRWSLFLIMLQAWIIESLLEFTRVTYLNFRNLPKAIWNCIIVNPLIRKHVRHLNEHIIYFNFSFLMSKVFETYQVYYTNLYATFEFTFTVNLKHVFYLPQKPQWLFFQLVCLRVSSEQIFSVSKLYCLMWSFSLFSACSCFPHFSWSRFFIAQVFLGPGPASRSRAWAQVLEVAT